MNQMLFDNNQFAKPHYIEELGCEGLSAEEVAQSLGVQAKHVRLKLRKIDLSNIAKLLRKDVSQVGVEISTPNETNNLTFNELFLTTSAAKLFVANYQNEIGRAYLAFLILLDVSVEKYAESVKQRQIAQKEILQLQESVAAVNRRLDEFLLEEASDHEYKMVRDAMTARLRRHHCAKEKYRQHLINDVMQRFYTDMSGKKLDYMPRCNWRKATAYVENLDWNYFAPLVMPQVPIHNKPENKKLPLY
jgi:hypothetical protein